MEQLPFFRRPIGMRRDPFQQGELGPVYRDAAGNSFQNLASTLQYTFTGTQRAGHLIYEEVTQASAGDPAHDLTHAVDSSFDQRYPDQRPELVARGHHSGGAGIAGGAGVALRAGSARCSGCACRSGRTCGAGRTRGASGRLRLYL